MAPPYPVGTAQNGDFFQSPLATLLILPFTFVSLDIVKGFAWAVNSLGLIYLATKLQVRALPLSSAICLLIWFAHSLSDIFLSLNFIFPVVVLLWIAHEHSLKPGWSPPLVGGFALAIGLFLRPTPILLLPLFLFGGSRRRCIPWLIFFLILGALLTFLVFPNPVLWWSSWIKALPLYAQAVDPRAATFQTPLSNLDRLLTYGMRMSQSAVETFKFVMGFVYWLIALFVSTKAECRNEKSLAFALLLSTLFCSFGPNWSASLFFCFPFFLFALRKGVSSWFWIPTALFGLLPKWLWPSQAWEFGAATLGLPGTLILIALSFCWIRTSKHLLSGQTPVQPVPGTP